MRSRASCWPPPWPTTATHRLRRGPSTSSIHVRGRGPIWSSCRRRKALRATRWPISLVSPFRRNVLPPASWPSWQKTFRALAGRRFSIAAGKAKSEGGAQVEGTSLRVPTVMLRLDAASGAIKSLRSPASNAELCDAKSGIGLNRYYYVLGDKVKRATAVWSGEDLRSRNPVRLVASLLVESDAPGCAKFSREIRVIDGLDRVDIINTLDKTAVREKEGVHLGFAFNVPGGTMRMDIPWAVMRPEIDQLPGACKNWFTVGRWVDVSNEEYGVTWATLDAPLVEVGAITANMIGSQTNPNAWLDKVKPSQTLYSWVMNNHWYTNYRAEQSGPTTFRYALRPHKRYDPIAAQRFGIECSQPLVVVPARGPRPPGVRS